MSRNSRDHLNKTRFSPNSASYQQTYATASFKPQSQPLNPVKVDPWDWTLDSSNTPSSQSSHSAHHSAQDPWDWTLDDNQNSQIPHASIQQDNKPFSMDNTSSNYSSNKYETQSSYKRYEMTSKEQLYHAPQHNRENYSNWQQLGSAPNSTANFSPSTQNFSVSSSDSNYQNEPFFHNKPMHPESQIQHSYSLKTIPNQQHPSWNVQQDNLYWKSKSNESVPNWHSPQNIPQRQEIQPFSYNQPETHFPSWTPAPAYSIPQDFAQQNWNVNPQESGHFQSNSNVQQSNSYTHDQSGQINIEFSSKEAHEVSQGVPWSISDNYNCRNQTVDQSIQNKDGPIYPPTVEGFNNQPHLERESLNKNVYQENENTRQYSSNTQMYPDNKEFFQPNIQSKFEAPKEILSEDSLISNQNQYKGIEKKEHEQTDHHHYDSAQITNVNQVESKQFFNPEDHSYHLQPPLRQNKLNESENRQNFNDESNKHYQSLTVSQPQETKSFPFQSLPQTSNINEQRQTKLQLEPSKTDEMAKNTYAQEKSFNILSTEYSSIRGDQQYLDDQNIKNNSSTYFSQEGNFKHPSQTENNSYKSNFDYNPSLYSKHENLEYINSFEKHSPSNINKPLTNIPDLGNQAPHIVSQNNYNIEIDPAMHISKVASQTQSPSLEEQHTTLTTPKNVGDKLSSAKDTYLSSQFTVSASPSLPLHLEQANLDDAPNQEVVEEHSSQNKIESSASKNNNELLIGDKKKSVYPPLEDDINQEMIPENLEKPPDIESFSKSRNLRSLIRPPLVVTDSSNVSLLDSHIDLPQVTLIPSSSFDRQHISVEKVKSPYVYDKIIPSEKKITDIPDHELHKEKEEKQMAAHLLEKLQKLDINQPPSTRSSSRPNVNKENSEEDKKLFLNKSLVHHHVTESKGFVQNGEQQEKVFEEKDSNNHEFSQNYVGELPHEPQNALLDMNSNNPLSEKNTFKEMEAKKHIMNVQPSEHQNVSDQPTCSSFKVNYSSETEPHYPHPLEQKNDIGSTTIVNNDLETNFSESERGQTYHSHPDMKMFLSKNQKNSNSEQVNDNQRDFRGHGSEGRRHSFEEPSSHIKEKGYSSSRRDSLDSHISSKIESRQVDPEMNLQHYEDESKDEQRRHPQSRSANAFHKKASHEDTEIDNQYRHHRQDPKQRSPYSEASHHSFKQSRYPSDYRYNEGIPPYRERQKFHHYDDDYFSDASRPSSRASIDERFHKENASHYRSITPSMIADSERGHDFYESRSNYEDHYRRRYGHGYYHPHPYPPGYGYPFYSFEGHPYYNYYRDYRNAYYNYYQRPNPESAYPASYYDSFHRGNTEYSNQENSSMPPSFSEEFPKDDMNKYSQDMEQNSFIESEASIPSIHSENHFQIPPPEQDVQMDGPPIFADLKYKTSHCIVRFTPFGQLLMVVPGNIATHVEIHDLQQLLSSDDTFNQLKDFPGPLIKSKTYKNNVLQICQKKLRLCEDEQNKIADYGSYVLLWKLMIKLLRQNGNIEGSDIADLLLEDHVPSRYASRQQLSSQASHENLLKADNESSFSGAPISHDEITNKFRELLLYGNKHEALEYAMKNSLWGHALFLASKMDSKHHSRVLTRFANSLAQNDPLQTLYQLMSNRQPAAVTCVAEESWGDWRPHLAMILSNPTHSLLDRSSIITLAESLYSRDHLYATHFCYLLVQEFGSPTNKKNGKVILIGSNNSLPFKEFARPEAIQWTEIYEYALSLAGSYYLPHFIPYKLYYASLLIDYGFTKEAFEYLEILSEISESYHLRYMIYDLANRIRCFDPQMEAEEVEWIDNLWRNIYGTTDYQSNSEVSSTHHLDECGSVEPLPPSFNSEVPPAGSTSEQAPPYFTSVDKPPESNDWNKPLGSEVKVMQDTIQQPPDFPPKLDSSFPLNSSTITTEPSAQSSKITDSSASAQPFNLPRKQSFNASLPSRQHMLLNKQSSKPSLNLDKKKQDKKKPIADKPQSSRWLGGIFSMFLPKQPTQMILPDDKNPSIVYDNEKKRWVDLTADEEETMAPEAPPADMDLKVQPTEMTPPPPGVSRFSRPKSMPIGSNYVNVNSSSVAPSSQPELLPELEIVARPPPQAANFFNPADFSSKTIQSPQASRNPYSKQ